MNSDTDNKMLIIRGELGWVRKKRVKMIKFVHDDARLDFRQ